MPRGHRKTRRLPFGKERKASGIPSRSGAPRRHIETSQENAERIKKQVQDEVDRLAPDLLAVSRFLHANPEMAYEEHQAADLLSGVLQENGFAVERGMADLPTAFTGLVGSGAPRIAFLAEYDALPGLGHACGHNLIGIERHRGNRKTHGDRFLGTRQRGA